MRLINWWIKINWSGHWTRHWLQGTELTNYLLKEAYGAHIAAHVFMTSPLLDRLSHNDHQTHIDEHNKFRAR